MSWQAAIGFSILASIITILVQRGYSLKSLVPDTFPPATSYLLGVMPIGIIIGLSLPHGIHWGWWVGLLLIICAATMAISYWINFKAVKLMPVAPYQTMTRFTNILTIALGWLLLGEKLNLYQLSGAALLLLAAALAAWAPIRRIKQAEQRLHWQSVTLTLIAASLLGISLVTEKAILGHAQVGGVLIFGWGAQTLAMLLLALKDFNRTNFRKYKWYELRWSWLMGLANGISGAFYVYALNKSNSISIITALTAIALPLTVFGAHIFLKERDNSKLILLSLTLCFVGLLVFVA